MLTTSSAFISKKKSSPNLEKVFPQFGKKIPNWGKILFIFYKYLLHIVLGINFGPVHKDLTYQQPLSRFLENFLEKKGSPPSPRVTALGEALV